MPPSSALRQVAEAAMRSGGAADGHTSNESGAPYNELRLCNYSLDAVKAMTQLTAGPQGRPWLPRAGLRIKPHANLAYFEAAELATCRYALHIDSDMGVRAPRPWLSGAAAIFAHDPTVVVVQPPDARWLLRRNCAATWRSACSTAPAVPTDVAPYMLNESAGSTSRSDRASLTASRVRFVSSRVYLLDVHRYRTLYGSITDDCWDARAKEVAAVVGAEATAAMRRFHSGHPRDVKAGFGVTREWEGLVSCAAIVAGLNRADMCPPRRGEDMHTFTWHPRWEYPAINGTGCSPNSP